jgi:predicted Zn-dependent protease
MIRKSLVFFSAAILLVACYKNPITGRNQFSLVDESTLKDMSVQQYRQFLSTSTVVPTAANKDAEMVRRIGSRISSAITNFYSNNEALKAELATYQWEYNLVDNKEANAWCMPGGKIVVYTGLLPITQNEAALAVVMGHEIAHALARHGNERMSQGLLTQLGGVALQVAVANKSQETQNLFLTAYGIGTQVGVALPHGRSQELEADRYGLIFAALAGYNPKEAIPLWQRMEKLSAGNKPPEFLSTHPAEATRIAELQKHMDEALGYYRPIGSQPPVYNGKKN